MLALGAHSGLAGKIRNGLRAIEDWWFDSRHRIDTAGDPAPSRATDVVGASGDGHVYAPARVRNVDSALEQIPARDLRSCTFIDLGSGKGRVVVLAAERPFKRVVGVEYSRALHERATANLRSLRRTGHTFAPIDLVLADAASYAFPSGNLVLHLFNPFGPEIMGQVLRNLQVAMQGEPRVVYIILLWPELSHMVEALPEMRIFKRTRRFDIFRGETL